MFGPTSAYSSPPPRSSLLRTTAVETYGGLVPRVIWAGYHQSPAVDSGLGHGLTRFPGWIALPMSINGTYKYSASATISNGNSTTAAIRKWTQTPSSSRLIEPERALRSTSKSYGACPTIDRVLEVNRPGGVVAPSVEAAWVHIEHLTKPMH